MSNVMSCILTYLHHWILILNMSQKMTQKITKVSKNKLVLLQSISVPKTLLQCTYTFQNVFFPENVCHHKGWNSTVAERAQRAARKHMQIEKAPANKETNSMVKMLTTQTNKETHCKCSQHNQINFICSTFLFLVVLWAFAVCFFFWLCCEHLQHVCCQIEEVVFLICRVFFLFAARRALSATIEFPVWAFLP